MLHSFLIKDRADKAVEKIRNENQNRPEAANSNFFKPLGQGGTKKILKLYLQVYIHVTKGHVHKIKGIGKQCLVNFTALVNVSTAQL